MKIIRKEIIEDARNYYDITVDKYHNFVLANGAVVHNCGCGTGFSVQKHHVDKLPELCKRDKGKKLFVIPDSIEGWADAIGVLVQSYFKDDSPFYCYDLQSKLDSFSGYQVEFDFSLIRPEGSPISWGGKAPGPKGLKTAVQKIESLIDSVLESGATKLKPINAYDIIMHSSDAVLSGGIRRSATICLFSPDDEEMINAKTGNWFVSNPQRGRSNNSAVLIRSETTKEQFNNLMESVKQFGEPGFVWSDNTETLFNPCCEISFYNYDQNEVSGWGFCNLSEINGKKAKTKKDFLDGCRAASIIGTLQAAYDHIDYLSDATNNIIKRDALLGVSITGMMDNPEVIFDPEIQKEGAKLVLEVNEKIAKAIGIEPCTRATAIKPSGTASCILGTASGIHPAHAKRYLRRVQSNKLEFPAQHFNSINPLAVEKSVWSSNGDLIINFLCEVPDGAKTKNSLGAIELLEHVKLTQQNWIEYGTRTDKNNKIASWLRHNVSNTINVKPNEWDDVSEYIYENRQWFAGISLLPNAGELDYPQAPFVSILNEKELVQTYGEGTVFASGLIVDALYAFDDNLWNACDCALGIGENLKTLEDPVEPIMPVKNGYTNSQWTAKLNEYSKLLSHYYDYKEKYDKVQLKLDWIRRFKQFAERYCQGNERHCTHMLKHVSLWKRWLDLKREYKDIDWSQVVEETIYEIDVTSLAGATCHGGSCDNTLQI